MCKKIMFITIMLGFRVGTMSELLEREHERGSAAMVKRLANLEEQVCECTFGSTTPVFSIGFPHFVAFTCK